MPQGSPNYNWRAKEVAYWLVEVNEEGQPEREIGFNAQHEPILFATTDRNYGLWTDSNRVFSLAAFAFRDEFSFEETWNALYKQTLQGSR